MWYNILLIYHVGGIMEVTRVITGRSSKGTITSYKYLIDGKEVPEGFKYCPVCSSILEKSLFSPKGNACKECAKARARAWYHEAKQSTEWKNKRNARVAIEGLKRKKEAVLKMGGKCVDCHGVFHPSVYDFHHTDPSQKDFNIGNILRGNNINLIEKELTKCVLLCANCHRLRHFEGGKNEITGT